MDQPDHPSEQPSKVAVLMNVQSGSATLSFTELFDTVKDDLWGYLVNHVQGHHDAEDLYQEISLKVFKNLKRLQDPAKFRSWFFAIAINSVRTFFRKKRPVSLEELSGDSGPEWAGEGLRTAEADPVQGLEKRERLRLLRQCIGNLPERERHILLLDAMAELPQHEIARQLDMNLNTVKTIIRRGKIKLARMMVEARHG